MKDFYDKLFDEYELFMDPRLLQSLLRLWIVVAGPFNHRLFTFRIMLFIKYNNPWLEFDDYHGPYSDKCFWWLRSYFITSFILPFISLVIVVWPLAEEDVSSVPFDSFGLIDLMFMIHYFRFSNYQLKGLLLLLMDLIL